MYHSPLYHSFSIHSPVYHSPFQQLESFDAIQSLPPDIMHDVSEGIIPTLLNAIIEQLHHTKILSKGAFCESLNKFQFGKNESRNKLLSWMNGNFAKLTAAQAGCLFRIFPYVLSNHIPSESMYWKLCLLLSNIIDIVFAPVVLFDWLNHLDNFIHEFFYVIYVEVVGIQPTPKLHYLLHYARHIFNYGPLKRLWCMKFEAYYQKLKKIVKRCRNFKNVVLTVADRLQLLKCWELLESFCLAPDPSYSGGIERNACDVLSPFQKY